MDLVDVLQKMGAIISVDTDRTIHIEGSPGCAATTTWP